MIKIFKKKIEMKFFAFFQFLLLFAVIGIVASSATVNNLKLNFSTSLQLSVGRGGRGGGKHVIRKKDSEDNDNNIQSNYPGGFLNFYYLEIFSQVDSL